MSCIIQEAVEALACGHTFHASCISANLEVRGCSLDNMLCPLCKKSNQMLRNEVAMAGPSRPSRSVAPMIVEVEDDEEPAAEQPVELQPEMPANDERVEPQPEVQPEVQPVEPVEPVEVPANGEDEAPAAEQPVEQQPEIAEQPVEPVENPANGEEATDSDMERNLIDLAAQVRYRRRMAKGKGKGNKNGKNILSALGAQAKAAADPAHEAKAAVAPPAKAAKAKAAKAKAAKAAGAKAKANAVEPVEPVAPPKAKAKAKAVASVDPVEPVAPPKAKAKAGAVEPVDPVEPVAPPKAKAKAGAVEPVDPVEPVAPPKAKAKADPSPKAKASPLQKAKAKAAHPPAANAPEPAIVAPNAPEPAIVAPNDPNAQASTMPLFDEPKLHCSYCNGVVGMSNLRIRSKKREEWICSQCQTTMTKVHRSPAGVRAIDFSKTDLGKMQAFFAECKGKAQSEINTLSSDLLKEYKKEENFFDDSGTYLPLSVWKQQGFDIDSIVEHSKPSDVMDHDVLGKTYRVPLLLKGNRGSQGYNREASHTAGPMGMEASGSSDVQPEAKRMRIDAQPNEDMAQLEARVKQELAAHYIIMEPMEGRSNLIQSI